jgi:hypothetical protein
MTNDYFSRCRRNATALLVALALAGCASKPVSIVVEKGVIQVDGLGLVSGERVRYRSGLLEAGEAAVTFDGKASGFPSAGPLPPLPPVPPGQ